MPKGKKKAQEEQEAEDFAGLGGLFDDSYASNDWGSTQAPGWHNGPETIYEEDEEDDDDDDEEEEYEQPLPKKGKGGGGQWQGGQPPQYNQQQYNQQQYNQQQHNQQHNQQQQQGKGGGKKGNKGNQQHQHQQGGGDGQKPPKGQQNQNQNQNQKKGQKQPKGQKPQKQQQDGGWGTVASSEWGGGGGTDWGEPTGGGGGWGEPTGGGGSEWGGPSNQSRGRPMHPQQQQERLASLLNQRQHVPWTPTHADRGRMSGSQQQGHGQGRPPTAAESVKAAANGRPPSRTLLYAATGSTSSVLDGGARGGPHTTVNIVDSGGRALEEADRALYSHVRPANQRIHWMFSPTKDERVASLLDWIQAMSHGLATLGLHKFLRTQQRGALMANADFRPWKAPNDPAFDWVTFDDVIDTHDKTLQESIAFYPPDTQVLVFVFLLSRSGNSLAMWRRKLPVPNAVRNQNRAEIAKLTGALGKRKYVLTVDELPPPPAKQKKKWFNVRW